MVILFWLPETEGTLRFLDIFIKTFSPQKGLNPHESTSYLEGKQVNIGITEHSQNEDC